MSDVDLGYDDLDDPQAGDSRQERNFKQLRERAKAEKEAREAAEKRLAELEEADKLRAAETRRVELKLALTSAGLPESFASVVPADVEPTKDAVTSFAVSIGYIQAPAPDAYAPAPVAPAANAGFVPLTAGGHGVPDRVSYEEFQTLLRTNPQKAEQLYESGRVDGLPVPQVGGALGAAERFQFEIPIEHYRPSETERRQTGRTPA